MNPIIATLLAKRSVAWDMRDMALVVEIDSQLARLGYVAPETTVADAALEAPVPERPRRGRPPGSKNRPKVTP